MNQVKVITITKVDNGYIVNDGRKTMVSKTLWYDLEPILREMVEYNKAEGEGGNG